MLRELHQNSESRNKRRAADEESDLCSAGREEVRAAVCRVALAHILAWSGRGREAGHTLDLQHEIDQLAEELSPWAGLLSRHLSRGAQMYAVK